MHHVPFIKTRSLSHLPCFCQPKKNSTSYPLESYLVPQPYIQPLRDFHPPFLLPISYFFSHCYHYCLGSYICFFFFNNKTLTKPTQLLPVNLLQHHFHLAQSIFTRLGVLPTLQNGIPVPSWSHLRLLFHSYFSLFLKTMLKAAWCTHYSPINHKTFMS